MLQRAVSGLILSVATSLFAGIGVAQTPPSPAPAYVGLKKTVSVDFFQAAETLGGAVTAEGMAAMLTAALINDGRFVVVERIALNSINVEQVLGQNGAVAAAGAARVGQLLGAGAIVRGIVTKFEPAASGGAVNLGGLPLGKLLGGRAGVSSRTSLLEISLRLIDTTTGQVISTSSAQGTASASTAGVTVTHAGSGAALGGDSFKNTPIGQAGEQAIIKAVELIATGMRRVPWSALVVDATETLVYINAGATQNVEAGMLLNVYRHGKVLTDPGTGEVLDIDLQKIGVIRVENVREKVSTAVMVSGEMPTRGNLLKRN